MMLWTYKPHSEDRKAKMAASQRARLGIPDGYRRVKGVLVPIKADN